MPFCAFLLGVTIDIESGSLSVGARIITGLAGVTPAVFVANTGYEQHAASLTYGSGHYAQVGAQLSPVETPGDAERLVALRHHAGQLTKCSLIENIRAKTEW